MIRANIAVHKNLDVILEFVAKDAAKTRINITAARFAMVADPDTIDAGPYVIDRKVTTTPSTTNGQITDGPNGEFSIFINVADQSGITRLAKDGAYFYQVAIKRSSDSKFVPIREGNIFWHPGVPTWV